MVSPSTLQYADNLLRALPRPTGVLDRITALSAYKRAFMCFLAILGGMAVNIRELGGHGVNIQVEQERCQIAAWFFLVT